MDLYLHENDTKGLQESGSLCGRREVKGKGWVGGALVVYLTFYLLSKIKIYIKNSCSKTNKMLACINSKREIL